MLAIRTSPKAAVKQAWAFCRGTKGRNRDGSRSYQHSMSNDAYGEHGVASNSDRES